MKIVGVKCRNCGKEADVIKSKSGIPCFNGGFYCGVMRIVGDVR